VNLGLFSNFNQLKLTLITSTSFKWKVFYSLGKQLPVWALDNGCLKVQDQLKEYGLSMNASLKFFQMNQSETIQRFSDGYQQYLSQGVCSIWAAKGIIELAEANDFVAFKSGQELKPGDRVYFNNDYQSVALTVIGDRSPLRSGFNIIGAHLDSPQLMLRINALVEADRVVQLKTRNHGNSSWQTWFNQPLGIAGRVFDARLDSQGIPVLDPESHLPIQDIRFVKVDSPAAVIPLEALLMNETLNEGRKIDMLRDLNPICAITRPGSVEDGKILAKYVEELLKQKGIDLNQSERAELYLFPTMQPTEIGYDGSMILAHGQDDQAMCFATIQAMIETAQENPVPLKTCTAFFFTHEAEKSGRGSAASAWIETVSDEILKALPNVESSGDVLNREEALSRSFILSANMAHALIPPHAEYFDIENPVYLGSGPVVSMNTTGNYGGAIRGVATIQTLCKRHGIPLQINAGGQPRVSGTAIAPLLSAQMNAVAVDIGAPLVSMHACQELSATVDIYLCKELFRHFYLND
jgi:aspartyl aminopeptidase